MNSLPVSSCDKTGAAAPCHNESEKDGASAAASLWGRDITGLDTVDIQQLARKALDCGFSTVLMESDCLPSRKLRGLPVNSEVHNHLENTQKLVAVLSQFGWSHPFYSREGMLDYAAEIYREFAAQITASISNSKKCNILISLVLAYQFSFRACPDSTILQAVANMDATFFSQYLRSVELYRQMSTQPVSTIQTEQVQELYELVQETEFFPGAWLLIRLALDDENRYLFSPFFLPSLLAPFLRRADELNMLINVFAAAAEDTAVYFNKLDKLIACVDSFEISPVHVFMAQIAAILNDVPVTNNKWLEQHSKTPESVQMIVFAEWSDIVNSRTVGGKDYIRNLNARCSYEDINSMITQAGKQFISKRQFKSMRGELFKQHDKGTAARRHRHIQLLQDQRVQDSPCLTGLIRLTIGLMYWCSSSVDRRPMTALVHLVNAAETGAYPLLHKNAGDIYFGFGLFAKAREQYRQLYSHDDLPESLKKRLESLIEICELNIPTVPESVDDTSALEQPQEKAGKTRSRQRKKANRAIDALPQQSANEAVATVPTLSPDGSPKNSSVLPPEDLAASTSGHNQDNQNQDNDERETLTADQVPVGFTTVSSARAKKTRDLAAFRPKSGSFSDHNWLVQKFIRQVNVYRDGADLAGEKKCIERWLQDDLVYGRICEDAAWFYLRQCISPIQMEPEVLESDLRTMKQDQAVSKEHTLNFALDWVARAMACYLESPLERRVRSDRLKEVLISLHERYPDKKLDYEACKRLRSGCSGFGHIFSEWSALVRNHKMKELHVEKSHKFFALKRIADPLYYQTSDQQENHQKADAPEAGFFGERKVIAQTP